MRAPRVPLDARPKSNPLGNLALCLASICLLIGTVLLHDGVSNSDVTQTATIISGAALLSLGLMALWFAMKSWVERRRDYKNGDRVEW